MKVNMVVWHGDMCLIKNILFWYFQCEKQYLWSWINYERNTHSKWNVYNKFNLNIITDMWIFVQTEEKKDIAPYKWIQCCMHSVIDQIYYGVLILKWKFLMECFIRAYGQEVAFTHLNIHCQICHRYFSPLVIITCIINLLVAATTIRKIYQYFRTCN